MAISGTLTHLSPILTHPCSCKVVLTLVSGLIHVTLQEILTHSSYTDKHYLFGVDHSLSSTQVIVKVIWPLASLPHSSIKEGEQGRGSCTGPPHHWLISPVMHTELLLMSMVVLCLGLLKNIKCTFMVLNDP